MVECSFTNKVVVCSNLVVVTLLFLFYTWDWKVHQVAVVFTIDHVPC